MRFIQALLNLVVAGMVIWAYYNQEYLRAITLLAIYLGISKVITSGVKDV